MPEAPDLAAAIAAVRIAVQSRENAIGSRLRDGRRLKSTDQLLRDLRRAERVLEALADREEMAAMLYCNDSDTSDELWSELGESIKGRYRLHVDDFLAALLARAGSGG